MDNFQKALQMAATAFLFVIAAGTAIYLYTALMENTSKIIVASDVNNNASEYAVATDGDYNRDIKIDEIIMTILDIENNSSYIEYVRVRNPKTSRYEEFTANSKEDKNLYSLINSCSSYSFRSSYNYESKTLTYNVK